MYIKNELSPSLKETEWETFVHNFFVNLDWRVRNTLLKHQRNANDIRLAVCLFSSLFGIKDWRRMKREAAWKRFFLSCVLKYLLLVAASCSENRSLDTGLTSYISLLSMHLVVLVLLSKKESEEGERRYSDASGLSWKKTASSSSSSLFLSITCCINMILEEDQSQLRFLFGIL